MSQHTSVLRNRFAGPGNQVQSEVIFREPVRKSQLSSKYRNAMSKPQTAVSPFLTQAKIKITKTNDGYVGINPQLTPQGQCFKIPSHGSQQNVYSYRGSTNLSSKYAYIYSIKFECYKLIYCGKNNINFIYCW